VVHVDLATPTFDAARPDGLVGSDGSSAENASSGGEGPTFSRQTERRKNAPLFHVWLVLRHAM